MSTKWACRCMTGAKWRWVADALARMRRGKDSTWVQWKNFNFIISSPRGVFCSSAIQFYYDEYTLSVDDFLRYSSAPTWHGWRIVKTTRTNSTRQKQCCVRCACDVAQTATKHAKYSLELKYVHLSKIWVLPLSSAIAAQLPIIIWQSASELDNEIKIVCQSPCGSSAL